MSSQKLRPSERVVVPTWLLKALPVQRRVSRQLGEPRTIPLSSGTARCAVIEALTVLSAITPLVLKYVIVTNTGIVNHKRLSLILPIDSISTSTKKRSRVSHDVSARTWLRDF